MVLIFLETSVLTSIVAKLVDSSNNGYEHALFSLSLSAFLVCFLDNGYSDWAELGSQRSHDLQFPDG